MSDSKIKGVLILTPREQAVMQSATLLLAAQILRQPGFISAQDIARMKWQALDAAKLLAEDVSPAEPSKIMLSDEIRAALEEYREAEPFLKMVCDVVIHEALELSDGRQKQAAALLGMKRTTFIGKLKPNSRKVHVH